MPIKDVEKRRAYQREWQRRKIAEIKSDDRSRAVFLEKRNEANRRYRQTSNGKKIHKAWKKEWLRTSLGRKYKQKEDMKRRYGTYGQCVVELIKLEREIKKNGEKTNSESIKRNSMELD